MEQLFDNKYVFWIVTVIVGGILGLINSLLSKRQADQEKKQAEIEKRMDKMETSSQRERERLGEVIANMPIQYTLRDEFLRVTTDQNRKLDKLTDATTTMSADISAIKAAVTGGAKNGN